MSELRNIRDRLVVVNGFSKAYAMTGWRIGYLLGPAEILSKAGLIHQHTATCAAAPSQYAALAALQGDQNFVDMMCRIYEKRRNLAVDGLKNTSFPLVYPEGTFYAMLDVAALDTPPDQKSNKLLERYGIASVNGISYGQSASNFVRLSLTVDEALITAAIERLRPY